MRPSPPTKCSNIIKLYTYVLKPYRGPGKGIIYDEMDDEEAGGFSVEAGYEKDGYNASIKYENDEMEDAPYRPWTRDSNWDEMDDEGGLRRHEALTQFWDEFADDE